MLSPALLVGILFGAFAGSGAELLVGDLRSDIAIYAICGMVAVASAVIGAPLTTILIVFELTRNYDLTIAAMVSVVFSSLVASRVFGRSLFDVQLRMRGFDLSAGRDRVVLERRSIADYVSPDFTAFAPELPLREARARLLAARRHEGYVIDAAGVYLGSVKLAEILAAEEAAGEKGVAGSGFPSGPGSGPGSDSGSNPRSGPGSSSGTAVSGLARRDEPVLAPETSVWAAMERMGDFVGETIPVLDEEEGGRLVGVVSEAAVVKAYRDTMNEIRREENAGA